MKLHETRFKVGSGSISGVLGLGFAVAGLFFFNAGCAASSRLDMPAAWRTLRVGMPKDEVIHITGAAGVETPRVWTLRWHAVGQPAGWLLVMRFNESGTLAAAYASFGENQKILTGELH